jgi:hypothetical protein
MYTFLVFFVLPKIVQNISEKKLSEILGRQTTISKIIINPYSFLFILENLNIRTKNADKSLLSLGQIKINFQADSLFKLGLVVKEVSISDPAVHITRNQDGSFNFSDLLPQSAGEEDISPDQKKEVSQPLRFFLANIRLNNGEIIFEDLRKDTTHSLTKMNLAIPFISNMDSHTDIFVTPYFAVNFDGAPFELHGESKPFTENLTTTMEFNLTDLELPKYFTYNPVPTQLDLVDGKLNAQLSLHFSTPDKQAVLPQHSLSGNISLSNLDIKGSGGADLFSLAKLDLTLSRSQILKGIINIDTLFISSPKLSLNRNNQESLNIYNLLPQKQDKEASTTAGKDTEMALQFACNTFSINDLLVSYVEDSISRDLFSINDFSIDNTTVNGAAHEAAIGKTAMSGGKLNVFRLKNGIINLAALAPEKTAGSDETERAPEVDSAQWLARLDDLVLQNFTIQADDLVDLGTGNISLEDISLQIQQLSNAANQQADARLNFKINQSGMIGAAGKIGIVPLQAEIDFTSEDIEIKWFQSFISQMANVVIPDGNVATKGHLSLQKEEEKPFKAQLKTDVNITDFKAIGSSENRDLVTFKKLALQGLTLDADPFSVNLKSISVKDPLANIIISEEGALNFSRIAKTPSSAGEEPEKREEKKEGEALPFEVDQLIVENGKVAIHDRSISPNFNTTLTAINSKVTGLSSDKTKQPAFKLNAMVNNHTPLKIDGEINPLATKLFLDMRMILTDMDLGVFTPYAGKYAGYAIQKGKMTLDLDYAINENQLNAANKVFLDQFDFGKEVQSEDAVNAPVTLAVALLKDPSGRISLDLPIAGNLEDPEFSIGGVIVEMIMNLLVKAATAPFSLLGAMFGGAEDLNILNFEAGTATLPDEEMAKVQTLITALTQRPALNLDIGGYANVEMDTRALKRARLERQLKSEKLKERIAQGSPITTVEDIQLTDEEYSEYLQAAFAAIAKNSAESEATSTQPNLKDSDTAKNSGKTENSSAPPTQEEMILALMEKISITNDDLRDLAQQRAMAVKDLLIVEGGIDAARVHTTAPDTLEPQEESLRSAGVIMALQ